MRASLVIAILAAGGLLLGVGCGSDQSKRSSAPRAKEAAVAVTTNDPIPGERLTVYRQRGTRLSGLGLAIALPRLWTGRIYRRESPEPTYGAIMQISDIHLPPPDGYDADAGVSDRLTSRDVLIVLTEHAPPKNQQTFPLLTPLLKIRSASARVEGVPDLHASALRFFSTAGRYFDVVVQFGTRPAPAPLLRQVNNVLRATLQIAQ